MSRLSVVAALVVALGGVAVLTAPVAHAECHQPVGPGSPLPAAAGQEPLIDRLGLRRVWELTTGRGVTVSVVDSGVDARHGEHAVVGGGVPGQAGLRPALVAGCGDDDHVPVDGVLHGLADRRLVHADGERQVQHAAAVRAGPDGGRDHLGGRLGQ